MNQTKEGRKVINILRQPAQDWSSPVRDSGERENVQVARAAQYRTRLYAAMMWDQFAARGVLDWKRMDSEFESLGVDEKIGLAFLSVGSPSVARASG